MISLVEHGRIKTTVEKAKELRRHIERAVTLGKKNDLATRRLLMSRIANNTAVDALLTDISPRFKNRAGGYTRIIKIGRRPGDTAEMAFIEFVDYDWQNVAGDKTDEKNKSSKKASKAGEEPKAKKVKKSTTALAAKKKTTKKAQKKARQAARV
ncbi:MAG: hypothetical protein BroJett040_17590 [Oligoflexia bacterium]|nr:MAG: hypothetical protein BroJett040_17590 [Oligoflexia bacterium]